MNSHRKSLLWLAVILSLFVFMVYGKVIFSPGSYLFCNSHDGIKNYYTYAYYLKNNVSKTNFEGMNYPYGESIMYTDCQPALAFLMKTAINHFPALLKYSIGIFNLLLILSFYLTGFILYFIFRELKINNTLAWLSAFGITLLCPQVFRLTGHYALSYGFFIPMTILLLLICERKKHPATLLMLLGLFILIFFFIHAYLGMISATLVIIWFLVHLIHDQLSGQKKKAGAYIFPMLTAVLPTALFYLFVTLTDRHTGRTNNPWGILESSADLKTVFLPVFGPLGNLKNMLFNYPEQNWEGWSYIGITATIGIIFFIVSSFICSFREKKLVSDRNLLDNRPLRILFFASVIILLFSMFLPFRLGMVQLANYFNIIKQFRAIGRFAWVFYFASTIMVVYMFNKPVKRLFEKKRYLEGSLLIAIFAFSFFYEGIFYHTETARNITGSANLFDIRQTPEKFRSDIKMINHGKYQAILSFPFFCIGSDNYIAEGDSQIYTLSELFSYHLGLPLVNSYLTRTSICESRKIMQLMASSFYKKDIRSDLPNEKPFLIISAHIPPDPREKALLDHARCLVKHERYSIYEIDKSAFFNNTAEKEYKEFTAQQARLFSRDGFLVSDTSLFFSYLDLNRPGTDISFSGKEGCYFGFQRNFNLLFRVEKDKLKPNHTYVARFWMYNKGDNCGQDCLGGMLFFQKRTGDKAEWLFPVTNAGKSFEINGDWSMVELAFVNKDTSAAYELLIKGNEFSTKTIFVDDLLFYDNELKIYRLDENHGKKILFSNNQRIELPLHADKKL